MPRKSRSKPRARKTASRTTRRTPADARRRLIRTLLVKLRDVATGLGLISALSFLPPSLVQQWPAHAQSAVGIGVDIRTLLAGVGADATAGVGAWTQDVALPAAGATREALRTTAARWLDGLEGSPPPEPAASAATLPRTASSFSRAKSRLYGSIYRDHATTFYCGCSFERSSRRTSLDGCGLGDYAGQTRADRVEAEHIFPAAQFGQSRRCWREPAAFADCRQADGDVISGRDCCQRVDPVFLAAHNDLHNLVPAVGLINGRRSNYNWGMLGGKRYGSCEMRIDTSIRRVQPPAAVRGDIARVMLYMRDTYDIDLSRQDAQLYVAWNNADPPDAWEIERDRRIRQAQGNGNGYVTDYRRL